MKTFVQIFLLTILLNSLTSAYTSLYVLDPRGWSGWAPGTIEEASLSIKPHGIYSEYELCLTFSARGQWFGESDTLEVLYSFDLPENSIVCDSWLWIGDTVVQAIIMDQWTASSIYEEIVNRRKDPSILFKRSATNYELRIFPMAGNSSRKVKITYMVPAQWNSANIISPLPTDLLQASANPLETFQISVYLNEGLHNPNILEYPEIVFQNDSLSGISFSALIPSEAIQNSLNLSVDAPMNNGIFVSTFDNGNEGFYQLAFLPSKALNISAPRKVALLVDYEEYNTTITKSVLLENIKTALRLNLTTEDSFNIILSKVNIQRISEDWIRADSSVIDSIFRELSEDQIAGYSNLPSLLSDGIDFVKNHGNDGSLLLVSSSDQVGDYQSANQLIDDLFELMDPRLPLHVVNYQNQNYSYNYIGDRNYYGNEYFYLNITRLTSANYYAPPNYYDLNPSFFGGMLADAVQSLNGYISSFDLHTKMNDGFCYARYELNQNISSVFFNKPILQVGKYNGNFPFIIETSGVYESEPFQLSFTLDESEVFTGDTMSEEIWAGNYIKFLEGQNQTNENINEIVHFSIEERVLSLYSAFICLEPNMEWGVCYDWLTEDDGGVIGVEDSLKSDDDSLSLSAYPNPFNSQINLNVKLPGSFSGENITFRIYDILGQIVKTFEPDLSAGRKEYRFTWNGVSDNGVYVSSGNYFFIVTTPEKIFTKKLLLLK
jgi:Ca-activated chloride channel family protein